MVRETPGCHPGEEGKEKNPNHVVMPHSDLWPSANWLGLAFQENQHGFISDCGEGTGRQSRHSHSPPCEWSRWTELGVNPAAAPGTRIPAAPSPSGPLPTWLLPRDVSTLPHGQATHPSCVLSHLAQLGHGGTQQGVGRAWEHRDGLKQQLRAHRSPAFWVSQSGSCWAMPAPLQALHGHKQGL